MKVAISADDSGMSAKVDPRFGRARYLVVIDLESNVVSTSDNTINQAATQGAGIQAAKAAVDAEARAVITGHVGPKALAALQAANVTVYHVSGGSVQQAVELFKQKRLVAVTSSVD